MARARRGKVGPVPTWSLFSMWRRMRQRKVCAARRCAALDLNQLAALPQALPRFAMAPAGLPSNSGPMPIAAPTFFHCAERAQIELETALAAADHLDAGQHRVGGRQHQMATGRLAQTGWQPQVNWRRGLARSRAMPHDCRCFGASALHAPQVSRSAVETLRPAAHPRRASSIAACERASSSFNHSRSATSGGQSFSGGG